MRLRYEKNELIAFHIVGSCQHDHWSAMSQVEMWDILNDMLADGEENYQIQTHALVLMGNHFHWLCRTQNGQAELICWCYQLHMSKLREIENPFVLPLHHIQAYKNTYAYIYKNPVSAGLVKHAQDYPFSTLPYILGHKPNDLKFNCWDQMNLFAHPEHILSLIHSTPPYKVSDSSLIRYFSKQQS